MSGWIEFWFIIRCSNELVSEVPFGAAVVISSTMRDARPGWVRSVSVGSRVLFWTLLSSAILTSLSAFAIPLLGGTREDLGYVMLIPTLASVGILGGVVALAQDPTTTTGGHGITIRRALPVLAALAVVVRWTRFLSTHILESADLYYLWILDSVSEMVLAFAVCSYLRALASRFEKRRFACAAGIMAWVSAAVSGLLSVDTGAICSDIGMSYGEYQLVLYTKIGVGLAVWVGALVLLSKFAQMLSEGSRGRCVQCGYTLGGLNEARCPECGTGFDGGEIMGSERM